MPYCIPPLPPSSRSFLWIIYLKITIVSLYFFHNFDNFFSGSSTSSILYTQTTFAVFHYLLIIAFSAYEIDLPYKFIRSVPYIYQLVGFPCMKRMCSVHAANV